MNMSIYEPAVESIDRSDLADVQLERLQIVVNRAYANVEFYRRRFDEAGLVPDDIKSLEDLEKIPFTTRRDLIDNYPYGMFAVPLKDVVRLQFPMGIYGNPIVIGYTNEDLKIWTELMARIMVGANIDEHDIIQVAFNYALFPGAIRFNQSAELIGAAVALTSIASAEVQLQIMQDFRSTVLASTPSFALHIAQVMMEKGIHPRNLSLRVGLLGAEPWPEHVRASIERDLGIRTFDIYGVTELVEPGLAGECHQRSGLHIFEDHFVAEVIDPSTGEGLPTGREGELVITTLTTGAYPLLRYRTCDITAINRDPCPCGRTMARMGRVSRRTDDMIVVRGINVFPEKIEEVLGKIDGIGPRFSMKVTKKEGLNDQLELVVDASENILAAEREQRDVKKEELKMALRRALGIRVDVDFPTSPR